VERGERLRGLKRGETDRGRWRHRAGLGGRDGGCPLRYTYWRTGGTRTCTERAVTLEGIRADVKALLKKRSGRGLNGGEKEEATGSANFRVLSLFRGRTEANVND